ncbi:MAG: hypothetical protein KIS67_04220 [Verrucomicrobiae bacterium]|nr:hypothetical protein [Verrucomicrobiae bacterium]
MSATTDGGKSKFFGFLRGIFRKSEADELPTEPCASGMPPAMPAPSHSTAVRATGSTNGNGPRASNGHGSGANVSRRNVATIPVSLSAVLAGLPLELRAKVKETEVGDLTLPVPLDKILSQLSQGSVKIPYLEVRMAVPHVFDGSTDGDRIPVALPLGEILSQINPALLVRRTAQKQVEVPADIVSPFDAKGEGLVFSVGNAKPVTPAAPRQAAPAPATPARGSISSVPTPTPPTASAPIQMPRINRPALTPTAPASPVVPATPIRLPVPPAAATPAPRPSPPPANADSLTVPLKSLAESWPDSLRQEIVQSNLVDAQLAVPCDLIENALKRGRAAFTWKILRSWITPALVSSASVQDETELELPLRVIAPLFLARQKSWAKPHQKVTLDDGIPNLFFGFPKPEAPLPAITSTPGAAVGPVNKPVDTNYYVWDDHAELTRCDDTEYKRKVPSGTDFVARYATPNEIVSRAAALDGVAGALIALPDGLMVANRIPPELNGDTLAAFLPQIFAKVSQCTKELRMGELNNLNFTVGNVPWKIFRVNAIFFAAFGRAAEALPTAQLAALASELDRKNK